MRSFSKNIRKYYVKKTENEKEAEKDEGIKNKGQLIVDATCTPADIRYPTDMSILNEARMNAEIFIDYLYSHFRYHFENKPRDYREVAHKNFIATSVLLY